MENENFVAYTPEDVERYYRFKTLGYNIGRVDGALYHLNHYCGAESSIKNPFYQRGLYELNKVRSMDADKLYEYISTWKWLDNRKIYLVCYADNKFKDYQNRLIDQSNISGQFDDIFAYNRNWLVRTNFYKKNKDILSEQKGGGNCAWKPYIILNAINKIKEGDIILYMDSADVLEGDIRSFLLAQDREMILTNGSYINSDWTKMDCFFTMGCDSSEYMDTIQLEAGVCVFKKCDFTIKIIEEWLYWCQIKEVVSSEEKYIIQNTSYFKEHRYDQSILTNLKIKYNLYSSNELRQFITCNVSLKKKISTDVTFIIPLFYDGYERKYNINALLKYFHRFNIKIIVGEQLDRRFEYLQVDKYIYFKDKQFHRTKMINTMVKQADTDIICICDADVILSELQFNRAIELISDGTDVVYPYSKYIKLTRSQSEELRKDFNYSKFSHLTGIESRGGMIFFNKESYIKGGMENEKFMIWGYEDFERYYRFKTLGYKIEILEGNLYHLDHHRGPNSIPIGDHVIRNKEEFEKVKAMNRNELQNYIKTW